ncbi:TerD family protein [Nocardioides acrostichi]|uniref:TerD family protein n=1 Tax=Nocardioides acrostichi TaxID=2784339 RepID=A0A930YBP0_9ACTN|nr:TerD family protein [Nocardioides acrostichi]MBF4162668.1 TerD family protein [Nocardioides acrostichi]
MAAVLPRGANAALTREVPGLDRLVIGVRFDAGAERSVLDDTVMMALLCDAGSRVTSGDDAVFFNQLSAGEHSVTEVDDVMGDDSEQVEIRLSRVPASVERVVVVAYVNQAIGARRTLAQLKGCTVRAVNGADGQELVRSENLATGWGLITAAVLAEAYRHQGGWKFKVIADGYAGGIIDLAKDFGVPL